MSACPARAFREPSLLTQVVSLDILNGDVKGDGRVVAGGFQHQGPGTEEDARLVPGTVTRPDKFRIYEARVGPHEGSEEREIERRQEVARRLHDIRAARGARRRSSTRRARAHAAAHRRGTISWWRRSMPQAERDARHPRLSPQRVKSLRPRMRFGRASPRRSRSPDRAPRGRREASRRTNAVDYPSCPRRFIG